jgi:hypothetical protein
VQTDQTYQLAWLIYALAALGVASIVAYWVRRWGGSWAAVFAVVLASAVVLMTPARATSETEQLAPAFIVATFDALAIEPGAFARAGVPLLALFAAAVVLGLLVVLGRHLVLRGRATEPGGES